MATDDTAAPILVTGATGTVGRALVAELLRAGYRVRAAARRPARPTGDRPGLEAVVIDLDDVASWRERLAGVERLCLLTPLDARMVERDTEVVSAAARAGVRHVVRLSALGAGDPPATELGRVHREVERAIERSGMTWTFLRPNAFMQNTVTYFADTIRAEGRFFAPQGDGRVSAVDTRDVAAVAAAALVDERHVGQVYELTGPAAISNHEVAEQLSSVLGRRIDYVDVTRDAARDALRGQGMHPWLVDVVMELYAMSAAGGAERVSPAVEAVLGRPATSFAQFAADHADAFRFPP